MKSFHSAMVLIAGICVGAWCAEVPTALVGMCGIAALFGFGGLLSEGD